MSQQDLALVQRGMAAVGHPDRLRPQLLGLGLAGVAGDRSAERVRARSGSRFPTIPRSGPGGFAEAKISAGGTTAPLLPQSAVLSDDKGNYVYVINGKNEVERRAVKIGEVDDQGVDHRRGPVGPGAVVAVGRAVPQSGAEGRAQASGRRNRRA